MELRRSVVSAVKTETMPAMPALYISPPQPLWSSDEANKGRLLPFFCTFRLCSLPPVQEEKASGGNRISSTNDGVAMTPEEFAAKVEDLRAVIADKITDLEEDPGWGSEDDRQEVIQALDELIVQAQALSEVLQQDHVEGEESGEDVP